MILIECRNSNNDIYIYICYIIAEGFFFILSFFIGYILSFSLVRLRTIWLCARAGGHIECSSCSRAEYVTITNVIIKTPDRLGCEWRHARKRRAGNFGDFWKKQLVEIWHWMRLVEIWSWARWVQFVGYRMCARLLSQWVEILTLGREFNWGVDWKMM